MIKLSLCMIVKNEEAVLERCLESAAGKNNRQENPTDEIIIADTGSTDGTKKIAAVAFANCRIEEVYIPDSVTAIGNRAFDGCMALKEISFPTVFEADGNILPHCAALPEYIIDGLRVHHRGEPDEIKDL